MGIVYKPSTAIQFKDEKPTHKDIEQISWTYAKPDLFKKNALAHIALSGNAKYMALERRWWFWVEPAFGNGTYISSERSRPHEAHVLLMTDAKQREHVLMLPLFAGDWRAFLHGNEKGLHIGLHGGEKGSAKIIDQPLMLITKGKDPIALMRASMALLSERLKTFRIREAKRLPAFVDLFGWCTWNAFYQEVSEEKVLTGLETFKKEGIQPRFMILDDGWQDINGKGHMNTFETNQRFPNGLSPLIQKAKQQYGVELFGVWHALQGYWGGVNPKGPLAKDYEVIAKQGLKPCNMEEQEIGLVSKNDIHRFYQDFHGHLRKSGVDMVKIDSQSGMQELCRGGVGYATTMSAYQKAIQASTQTHFEGNLLHCMSNGQDVAYNMSASVVWRNSDDFYPNQAPSHAHHMVINAFNAVWSHSFACPDWDMFMSGHHSGAYHAAARAISGGPIYISDKPGEQNATIIKRLCLSDGRSLRSVGPALPLSRHMYEDPHLGKCLLFLKNNNGKAGVLGVFHCQFEGPEITDSFNVKDLDFDRGEYVLWYARAQQIRAIHSREQVSITLKELEAEIIHVLPLNEGVAAIGLIDKDNASAAIKDQDWDRDGSYRITLLDGGTLGVYSKRIPKQAVDEQGKELKMKHDENGLLQIKLKPGAERRCSLYW